MVQIVNNPFLLFYSQSSSPVYIYFFVWLLEVLRENQNIDQITMDRNSVASNELFSGLDDKFFPSDEILNELLLPDTRIFASLLNKDLNSTKQNTSHLGSNHNANGSKKTYADLTYKTVMIGGTSS